ncbi:hypothetical protein AN958_03740 [Leucoagaricus sp. SymC.cos]|nr:hypothetical protein AN958_03740 [Leucoagaricus sp. SymC.cos]
MWPNDIILMTALPSGDSGITARDWKTRGRFVQAFQRILVDWPGDVPSELAKILFHFNSGGRDVWHQLNMEKTEKLASRFYCQTFFDHFGRAPCIPHFFPVA